MPHWGLYSQADWTRVARALAQRGFMPGSVHIVTATKLERNGQSFALLAARSMKRGTCFAVARGTAVQRTLCGVSVPLRVFTAQDSCIACSSGGQAPLNTLSILVLVRPDVSVTAIYDGRESGMPIVPAGGGVYAFNSSGVRRGTILRARDRTGSTLAELRLSL